MKRLLLLGFFLLVSVKNHAGIIFVPPSSGGGSSGIVSLSTGVAGVLPIANGGTNASTALSGNSIMISDGSGVVQGAAGTTTTLLHGNAAGSPTYAQVSLANDVTGTLSGSSVSGGTFGAVNGSALTALNASNVASGSLADARLSANVMLLNSTDTVTASKTFLSVLISSASGTPTAAAPVGIRTQPPAAETITAGATITVNVCGYGVKLISSAGSVTTDTTNTFTAPSAGNAGCCFTLMNSGANNIVLDTNANFATVGAANITMTGNDIVNICSNGTVWGQASALVAL